MTKADWQARFTALNAALCSSLEAAALSKGDKETISASYSELVKCWLPKFSSFSDSHSPSSSSSSALEDRSMLTGFKRALRDKASPLPILPAHAAELLSTAVEALEHARRGKSGAGAASACVGVVSSNGKPAPLPAHSSSFTDDTALALGRHAGDDTALALADQLLAISSREGGEGEENEKSTSSSSSFDKALRSRLFKYACRGLREALRDILDDVGGDVQGRTSGSGNGNGNGGSGSGSSLSSAGGSFASSSADGGGIDSFHRASSSSWLLSALADGVTGLGGGGGGGGGGALVNGGGGSSNVAAFFGAAPAFTPAGTAIDLASIRLPSASFAKATVTLAADLAIGLDVAGSSEARATTKGASVVVVVGAKEAEEAKEANASSRPRRQQGGPHLALACDLLLESIEACVGLAWQAAGPSAAAGRGGFGGLGATTTTEEGSGSGSNSTSALVAAALTRHALDIGTALASAAPELLDATATAGVAAALDAPERVHALMRSAARLADVVCGSGSGGGEGGGGLSKRIWRWDLETKNEEGEENTKPQKPVSSFASAEALTDALSSSLTALLAAAWRAGDVEGVKAALVPLADLGSGSGSGVEKGSAAIRGDASNASFSPARGSFSAVNNSTINDASGGDDDSPYEQQAELLTAGRLAAALAGDAELLAVIVPLLAESGVGGASASSKATAMHVVASLAALAGCGGHLWAYDAQIDAMVKAYKSSEGAAGALLFAGGGSGGVGVEEQGQTSSSPSSAAAASSSPTAGALADALLVAAEGVKHAPLAVRRDLLLRLLALAADVGATTTTTIVPLTRGAAATSAAAASAAAAASSGDSRRDLGALLPAIAAVADAVVDRDAMSRAPKAAAWTDAEPSSSSTEASSSPPKKAAATASASSSSPTIANSSSSPKKKNKASKMMAALKKGASGTPRGAGGGAGGISDSKKREALEREAAEKAKSLIPSFVRRHGEPSAADIVKAFRLLWLYIGMHDFAGLGSGAGSTSSSNVSSTSTTPYPWPASWRAAVGRIAAFTPQIAALGEGESVKMAAELGPRVARLGGFGVAVGGGGAGFGAGAGAAAASSNAFYSVAPARPTTIAAASAAAHARASAGLLRLLGTSALPPMPASPDAPARVAHLLSVATLELSRAELAPLGACVGGGVFDDGGSPVGESDAKAAALPSPVAASPLDLLIDAQQDAEPGLWAGAALAAISDAAAAAYCSRLGGGVGGRGGCGASGEKQNHDSSEDIMPALERLVSSLVAASARSGTVVASAGGGGAMSAKASMLPPPPQSLNKKVKASAFPQALVSLNSSATATTTTTSSSASTLPIGTPARILADVLVAFPALYWRPVLLRSALACCGAEEKMVAPGATTHHAAVVVSGGAAGRKNNHNSSPFSLDGHPSLALARQVLATAASVAPEHAEALLHEQLRGGGGGGGGGKSRGGISSSSSSALALPSSSSSSAPAAALRHAATLMATLDAARPRFDAEAPTAPIAGVEALSRKAYYGGAASAAAASAAMNASSSSSSPSAAAGGSSHGSHRGLSEAVQRLERVLVAFQQQGASGSKLSSSSSSSTSAAAPSLPPPPPSTTVKPTVASLEDAVLSLAAAIVTAAAEEEDEWRKAAAKRAKKLSSSSSSSSLSSSSKPLPPLPSPALSAAIRALGAAPARRLTPVAVRVSTMAWAWVAAAAPGLRVPLAAAVAAAWSRTQDAHAGLFSRSTLFDAELFHMSPGGDPDDHPELTRGVKAHAAWLEYWTELWFSVCADGGGGVGGGSGSGGGGVHVSTSTTSPSTTTPNFTPAVSADAQSIRSLLSRLLHRALENARHLTQHPASDGARARLARLALLLAKSELACSSFSSSSSSPSSSSSSAAAVRASNARLLAQRALRASLLWFEGPPALYGRWSPDEAEEQVSAAAELAALVGDGRWFVEEEVAVSKKKSKTSSPGSFASSSTTTNLTNTTSAPDPVWGHCPGATPEQRVSLLKLLLDAEVERTASWARPLAVPSNPRSPYARFSDHKWRGLVGAAWAVSPKLALSLPERLPESGAVEEALEELVVRHASEPELQGVPRGAAILANSVSNSCGGRKKKKSNSSACGCGGGDGAGEEELGGFSSSSSSFPSSFDPFRSTSPTDALALWAPAPLLQALAMLGGPAGGVPAVRAYALRSLEGCDPEQVRGIGWLVEVVEGGGERVFFFFLLALCSRQQCVFFSFSSWTFFLRLFAAGVSLFVHLWDALGDLEGKRASERMERERDERLRFPFLSFSNSRNLSHQKQKKINEPQPLLLGLRLPPAAGPAPPRRRRRPDPRLPARRRLPLGAVRPHAGLHPQRRRAAPARGLHVASSQEVRLDPTGGHGPLGRGRRAEGAGMAGHARREAGEADGRGGVL